MSHVESQRKCKGITVLNCDVRIHCLALDGMALTSSAGNIMMKDIAALVV
jgi:hypothetical protein